jgi:hypothetical protein
MQRSEVDAERSTFQSPAARRRMCGKYSRGVVPCGTGAKTCTGLQWTTLRQCYVISVGSLGFGIASDADVEVTGRLSLLLLLTNAGRFSRGILRTV